MLRSFAQSPSKLWELWTLSKAYRVRPSVLINMTGQEHEVAAFCLDRGVHLFGTALENEIGEQTRNLKTDSEVQSKSRQIMAKWLAKPGEVVTGQFRDPLAG